MNRAHIKEQKSPPVAGQDRKRQVLLRTLLLLLLLGAGGFFIASLWLVRPEPKAKIISANSQQAEALVNKHLFYTSQSKYLREKEIDVENSYLAPALGDSIWPKIPSKKEGGVDHSPDSNEGNAFEDLRRYRKDLQYTNPDQIIQGQIADENLGAEAEAAYREEYARQFVENARRNGYSVKLNEDFVVVEVTPIRRISPSGGASQ